MPAQQRSTPRWRAGITTNTNCIALCGYCMVTVSPYVVFGWWQCCLQKILHICNALTSEVHVSVVVHVQYLDNDAVVDDECSSDEMPEDEYDSDPDFVVNPLNCRGVR